MSMFPRPFCYSYVFSGFTVVVAIPLYTTFVFMQFIPSNGQFSLILQLHMEFDLISWVAVILLLCLFIICFMFSVVL